MQQMREKVQPKLGDNNYFAAYKGADSTTA